jgi:hypothetical protein
MPHTEEHQNFYAFQKHIPWDLDTGTLLHLTGVRMCENYVCSMQKDKF